jgi:hypothetical protein
MTVAEKLIIAQGPQSNRLGKIIDVGPNVAGARKVVDVSAFVPTNARKVQLVTSGTAQKVWFEQAPAWVQNKYTSMFGTTPDVAVDFANNQAWTKMGGQTTPDKLLYCIAGSTRWRDDTSFNWTSFAPNTLAYTNKGLRVWEARTNSITNNSMQGAVAGSPGTVPTGWASVVAVAGLTVTQVGVGVENGIDYIEYNYSGTATATSQMAIQPMTNNAIAAASGQTWTGSLFYKLINNGATAPGSVFSRISGTNGTTGTENFNGTVLTQANYTGPIGQNPRVVQTSTLANAGTTNVVMLMIVSVTSGSTYNYNFRVGWPQLEQASFASPPIRTGNFIRNSAAAGAVVGTPGTLPTNWWQNNNTGFAASVAATGIDSGMDYIDLLFSGTSPSNGSQININLEAVGVIAAASGQTWVGSVFWKLSGGSTTNVSAFNLGLLGVSAGSVVEAFYNATTFPGASWQRLIATGTLANATTTSIYSGLAVTMSAGPINFTLRLAWPQLERGSIASPPQRTVAGTVGVNSVGEIVTLKAPPIFGNAFTLYAAGASFPASGNPIVLDVSTGASANRALLFRNNGVTPALFVSSGGVAVNTATPQTWSAGTSGKLAGAIANNDNSVSFNGNAVATQASSPLPVGPLTKVSVGSDESGGSQWDGDITEFAIWANKRIPDAYLVGGTQGVASWVIDRYTPFGSVYPDVAADFVNARAWTRSAGTMTPDQLLTCVSNSTRWRDDTSGNWKSAAPAALAYSNKGLRVWEARTNTIRNNAMAGAVVGRPGTLPTNWVINNVPTGITRTVVGTGTVQGIDYIDINLAGTATSTSVISIWLEPVNSIPAASGQAWTASSWLQVIQSDVNVTALNVIVVGTNGAVLTESASGVNAISQAASLARFPTTFTMAQGTTTNVHVRIQTNSITSGQTINWTVRIGWPQLEQAAFASPPIRTSSAVRNSAAAGAVVSDGVERVTNGTFTGTSGTGWTTVLNGGTGSIDFSVTGQATLNGDGTRVTNLTQAISGLTVGQWYSIYVTTSAPLTSPITVIAGATQGASAALNTNLNWGSPTRSVFNATATTMYVGFTITTGSATVSNISVMHAGAMPTNWGNFSTSLMVVGTGTVGGIDYVDVHIQGAISNHNYNGLLETGTSMSAAVGQTWTGSVYLALVQGSMSGISHPPINNGMNVFVSENSSGGGLIGTHQGTDISGLLTSTLQRFSNAGNLFTNPSTAYAGLFLNTDFVPGAFVDYTLRIGCPQMEQSIAPSLPQRTVAGTVGVNTPAEVITLGTPPTFGAAYTLYAAGMPYGVSAQGQNVLAIIDDVPAGASNRLQMQWPNGVNAQGVISASGSNIWVPTIATAWGANIQKKLALAFASGDHGFAVAGSAISDATAGIPTGMSSVTIGSLNTVGYAWDGDIAEFAIWPNTRVPNTGLTGGTT